MVISVFGLGYVGIVTTACLTAMNYKVIGVDINPIKVELLSNAKSAIVEKDVDSLLLDANKKRLITATNDHRVAVAESDVSFICVGTPSNSNGSIDSRYLENVCSQIALAIRDKKENHYINFRSTMLPGTMRNFMIPLLEDISGKKYNKQFYISYNPEFLRESTGVFDFYHPPKTVVGADETHIADEILLIYKSIPGPKIATSLEASELVKYVDNSFHALKITFANEIGQICKKLYIDSHEVMDIFLKDNKLNISTVYLSPGFAFGGSCLPKDLRAINHMAKTKDLELPMLNSILYSNKTQIECLIDKIQSYEIKKIGFAGFSFKDGTDDLRESPIIKVIESLMGKGYDLKLYDPNVILSQLIGSNKAYIEKMIPHIASHMVDSLDEMLSDRDLIVITTKNNQFKDILKKRKCNQFIIDLARITHDYNEEIENYEGIYW